MRSSSIIFALLLSPLGLAAQTPTIRDPTILINPPLSRSCPVKFSVDRSPQGAVVWTGSDSDWIRNHGALSLEGQQRALQNESGFRDLSPRAQQDKLDQLAQLYTKQHGQGLNIAFAKPEAQIVSADIKVHGYPASIHIIPVTPPVPADVTETFHLTAAAGQPLLHSSIWTNHIVVANWVELTRLDYADGTTWRSSTPHQCSATPSLYLLVDSAR